MGKRKLNPSPKIEELKGATLVAAKEEKSKPPKASTSNDVATEISGQRNTRSKTRVGFC